MPTKGANTAELSSAEHAAARHESRGRKTARRSSGGGQAPTSNIIAEAREDRRRLIVTVHIELLKSSTQLTLPAPPKEQQMFLDAMLTNYDTLSFTEMHVDGRFSPLDAVIASVESKLSPKDLATYGNSWAHAKTRLTRAWREMTWHKAEQAYEETSFADLTAKLTL